MKRKILAKLSLLLTFVMLLSIPLAGCEMFSNNGKTYTIQYTDDEGTHQLEVTKGMPYYIEDIPYRYGYEFLGLFDAPTGGTQYVSANGSSLTTYNDRENKVLYPQFKAIDYTVILDYQGAAVTGDRSLTVAYGTSLPELPQNLTLEHNVFTGWYTKAGSKGTQIADTYGNIAAVSVLNETNFDLDDTTHRVTLFAGFDLETYTVTFHFDGGLPDESVKVVYNTPISEVVPKTRNSQGFAGLVWSKTANDTAQTNVFNGKVIGNMDLYVAEWAPVIELDVNGGDEIAPVVARAGESVTLPTPTKSVSQFLYWVTADGDVADIETMPATGASLKAVWQAKIEFDENGGEVVSDISEQAGVEIELPTPTREGYVFAGWYTTEKVKYTTSTMPNEGIALKAGWYEAKEYSVTLVANDKNKALIVDSNTLTASNRLKIDLSSIFPQIDRDGVEIEYKIDFKWGNTYSYVKANAKLALYEGSDFNSNYEITRKNLSHGTDKDSYIKDSMSGTATIHNNVLYLYYCGEGQLHFTLSGGYGDDVAFFDITFTVKYPDTSTLYL